MAEELRFIGVCLAIFLLTFCDAYLAVKLWRERKEELKQLWLEIESRMIVILSRISDKIARHEDCPEWADPDRWNDTRLWWEK